MRKLFLMAGFELSFQDQPTFSPTHANVFLISTIFPHLPSTSLQVPCLPTKFTLPLCISCPILYLQVTAMTEYERKEHRTMLDKETSEKLQSAVLERLTKTLSNDAPGAELTKTLYRLAVLASTITLEEYEKLNQ